VRYQDDETKMRAFDLTPTMATAYEEKPDREETAVGSLEKKFTSFEETLLIGFQEEVPRLKRQTDSTQTTEELRAGAGAGQRDQDDGESLTARDVRLALLARKYEGDVSVEDTARMQILIERLRKLSPRVTDRDVEHVAEMVADAEDISARLAAVKEKFGLR
jgi:hypothetical protein